MKTNTVRDIDCWHHRANIGALGYRVTEHGCMRCRAMRSDCMTSGTTMPRHLMARTWLIGIMLTCLLIMSPTTAKAQQYEKAVEQALEAFHANNYDKADSLFRQALRCSPSDIRNALVYSNIAYIYKLKGDKVKALDNYTTALGIAPQNIPILKARADLYLELNNTGKALLDYSSIIDFDPNNREALLARAYIYQQRRDYYNAKRDYETLLTNNPHDYAALLGTAILFQNAGKPQEAITRLSLLIDEYADKAELYSIRAEIEKEEKHSELAIMDLNKAIELEPHNRNMVLSRAYLHLSDGNKRMALADFERAIELGVPRGQLREELKKCAGKQ